MCNLYRMNSSHIEIANLFGVAAMDTPGNAAAEIYPGYSGMVAADGRVRPMVWGFPLQRTGAKGQPLKPKPVNNSRSDKLSSPFWSASFRERRCLIPITAYAEAEGPKGTMTRTWLSVPGADLFAAAGLWRETTEWGAAYSMITAAANDQVSNVHSRMPVLLAHDDWQCWLNGSPLDAQALCKPWAGELEITRTDTPWAGGK